MRFETRVIPRTATIGDAEAGLANSLLTSVGGTRPQASLAQVRHHLGRFFNVADHQVSVRLYGAEDFLLVFSEAVVVDSVLHSVPPGDSGLRLVFHRWQQQAGHSFPLCSSRFCWSSPMCLTIFGWWRQWRSHVMRGGCKCTPHFSKFSL
jgi:hypothetical protein